MGRPVASILQNRLHQDQRRIIAHVDPMNAMGEFQCLLGRGCTPALANEAILKARAAADKWAAQHSDPNIPGGGQFASKPPVEAYAYSPQNQLNHFGHGDAYGAGLHTLVAQNGYGSDWNHPANARGP